MSLYFPSGRDKNGSGGNCLNCNEPAAYHFQRGERSYLRLVCRLSDAGPTKPSEDRIRVFLTVKDLDRLIEALNPRTDMQDLVDKLIQIGVNAERRQRARQDRIRAYQREEAHR